MTHRTVRVAASFWSTPRDRVQAEADRLRAAGLSTVHWDHTDGRFARSGGFEAAEALAVTSATGLAAEAHLMVEEPLLAVDEWTEFCELVVVHAGTREWRRAVDRIVSRGSRAAVAVEGGAAVPALPPDLELLVMSITPGEAGATFRDAALTTIAEESRKRRVGVDGGVTDDLLPALLGAGARWLVSGTSLVSSDDPQGWLEGAQAGPRVVAGHPERRPHD